MSTLDARLAKIDEELREMQAALVPEREPSERVPPPSYREPGPAGPEPAPAAEAAPPGSDTPAPPAADAAAVELARRLLASTRELLAGYEAVLASAPPGEQVTVSAGPFRSTSALGEFERSLARIPGVSDVALRGFEGSDRAIVEVQLGE